MVVIRNRSSVEEFYRKALREGAGTAERLDAPVADRFAAFVNSVDLRAPRTALELGYGRGIYTATLARLGFHVTAVDQVPPGLLRRRLAVSPELAERVEIVQQHIENFCTKGSFGVVVAKDVLHYIEQQQVHRVLSLCVRHAPAGAAHYLEVFTDIERTDREGRRVLIDGEAAYTTEAFLTALAQIYRGWTMRITRSAHSETNTGYTPGGPMPRKYLHANRITAIAMRTNQARENA